MTLQKYQEMIKVKTTGLVRNFIIPANCWNHDWMSKSNGSMSYGVHKKSVSDAQLVLPGLYRHTPGDNLNVHKNVKLFPCHWHIFCDVIDLFAPAFIVLSDTVSQEVSTEKEWKFAVAQFFFRYSSSLLNQCILGVTLNFDHSRSLWFYKINVWS